jgi:protein-disulfide isomerase-like protein with CxxC motif
MTASFEYLTKIQGAFYREGADITQIEVLTEFLETDQHSAFLDFYRSKRAKLLMQHDFSKARSMGANAFPPSLSPKPNFKKRKPEI